MELKDQLNQLITEQGNFHAKATEELKSLGTVTNETKSGLEKLQQQVDAIDLKMVEQHRNTPAAQKSIKTVMEENDDVKRMFRDRKGHAVLNFTGDQVEDIMGRKTTILSGGTGFAPVTGGVVPIERMAGIQNEVRRRLRVRDLISARPTASPLIYYVKVSQPMSGALPYAGVVVEGEVKPENRVQFSSVTTQVQTIASWIPASKQILDDFTELEGFLRSSLPYYVDRAEEAELLSGDGTGVHLNGLMTQATAFNAALLSAAAGWTRIDQIGAAVEQVDMIDEVPPTFVALNPRDWWSIRRTKDNTGRYILGDPQTVGSPSIWDLTPVATNAIAAGSFLVGTGESAAAEIRDRMEMQVEISTEHADYFTRNLVAIRAEKRVALVVQRPQAFVTGTFSTSPAGL
jgi:HK97 family phage major capsid protein